MQNLYVDLAVPISVNKLFTYLVPPELHQAVKKGVRVIAPFGNRTVIGVVVNITTHTITQKLKTIHDVMDSTPILSEELLALIHWISEYYLAPQGEVVKTALVPGLTHFGKRKVKALINKVEMMSSQLPASRRQVAIFQEVAKRSTVSVGQLQKIFGKKNIYSSLQELERRQIVCIEEEFPRQKLKPKLEKVIVVTDELKVGWKEWIIANKTNKKTAQQVKMLEYLIEMENGVVAINSILKQASLSLSTIRSLEKKKVVSIAEREIIRTTDIEFDSSGIENPNIILNAHQQKALDVLCQKVDEGIFHPFLLYGITGSGKTQVYIETIRYVLEKGKTAIVLVPEISLTPQIVSRFKLHFGDKVAVLHSRMSSGERYDAWRLLRNGTYSIAIGPRSAIFAPLSNLGLIVVDEENESSYKQLDQIPHYHARDTAIVRAKLNNAVVILGSATPSLESYFNANAGKYTLLELPERVDAASLPSVELVDMKAERKKQFLLAQKERNELGKSEKKEFGTISDPLKVKIQDRLNKREGIILLQNRRGFSPFIECPDCSYVEMCRNCHISLTYHLTKKHLRCHYCGFVKLPPMFCPTCGSVEVRYQGFGTQRVEEEVKKLFPQASLMRMDLDTTTRKGSHGRILKKFAFGEVDILLGTQMVAKGLDFSRVTLVGVISADTQMLLPDFRSAERTFQLLTQVAGRAGRSTLSGEVIIQTFQPDHYALKHVVTHDFKSFYEEELRYRQELSYPPFSRIALVEFRGEHEDSVTQHAETFAKELQKQVNHLIILGPAPAALAKLRRKYRWHFILKSLKQQDPAGTHLHTALQQAVLSYRQLAKTKRKNVQVIIDVDPIGMM